VKIEHCTAVCIVDVPVLYAHFTDTCVVQGPVLDEYCTALRIL